MNETKHNIQGQDRRIRSFVRREGRLTPGQQRALDELWPGLGLAFETPLSLTEAFGREAAAISTFLRSRTLAPKLPS